MFGRTIVAIMIFLRESPGYKWFLVSCFGICVSFFIVCVTTTIVIITNCYSCYVTLRRPFLFVLRAAVPVNPLSRYTFLPRWRTFWVLWLFILRHFCFAAATASATVTVTTVLCCFAVLYWRLQPFYSVFTFCATTNVYSAPVPSATISVNRLAQIALATVLCLHIVAPRHPVKLWS